MHNKWDMCNKPVNGTERSKGYRNETNIKGEDCEAVSNSTFRQKRINGGNKFDLTRNPKDKCNFLRPNGSRGDAVGSGTMLQARISQVLFPMVSLEFFFDLILPATLWPRGRFGL
jgi:hypothetical protein